jgi:hypothetical protein
MSDVKSKPKEGNAIDLARSGLKVFPVRKYIAPPADTPADGLDKAREAARKLAKRPAIEDYPNRATTKEKQIEKWWAHFVNANIGVTLESKLVLDVDVRSGGIESFAKLKRKQAELGNKLPDTWGAKTASGGLHFMFALPEGVKVSSRAGALGGGLDIKSGKGSFIVGPGSEIEGRYYERTNNLAPAAAPQWLIDLCPKARDKEPDAGKRVMESNEAAIEAAAKYLLEDAPPAIEASHTGNDTTYRVFQHVKDIGVTEAEALELGLRCYNPGCIPPWSTDELKTIINNAYTYGQRPAGDKHPDKIAREHSNEGFSVDAEDCLSKVDAATWKAAGIPLDEWLAQRHGEQAEQPEQARGEQPEPVIVLHGHRDGTAHARVLWTVKYVLPQTGTGLLAGQWGMFKTFTALDLALSIILGTHFANRYRVKRAGGVLYLAAEGAAGIESRFDAAVKHRKVDQPLPFYHRGDVPRLLARGGVDNICRIANEAAERALKDFGAPLSLITIDTIALAAGYRKSGDGNDGAATAELMGAMSKISQRTGAFVLGLDHYGKDIKAGTIGSSEKEGAAETVLAALGKRTDAGHVSSTRLALRKVREGMAGDELMFTPKILTLGEDEDGDDITTRVIDWHERIQPSAEERKLLEAAYAIVTERGAPFGDDSPITTAEWNAAYLGPLRAATGATQTAATRRTRLLQKGWIRKGDADQWFIVSCYGATSTQRT